MQPVKLANFCSAKGYITISSFQYTKGTLRYHEIEIDGLDILLNFIFYDSVYYKSRKNDVISPVHPLTSPSFIIVSM